MSRKLKVSDSGLSMLIEFVSSRNGQMLATFMISIKEMERLKTISGLDC